MTFKPVGVLVVSLGVCVAPLGAGVVKNQKPQEARGTQQDLVPTGKGWGENRPDAPPAPGQAETTSLAPAAAAVPEYGIAYHGGPVMLGTTNVYYIWYGDWAGNTAPAILENLATDLGGSPYWNINTTYSDGSGAHVSNSVAFGGSTAVSYPNGAALSDAAIQNVVASAISSGSLPKDTNGVYFVLTSSDVTATSGFCTQYCGWHTHATIGGSDIKYSFVGNPDRCPSACAAQTTGPNGNAGADGMASIIAHELEESATDPDLNAWYDNVGNENADKCAWTFGAEYLAANGARANMTLGGRDFLIQRNWLNTAPAGSCALGYQSPSDFTVVATPASSRVDPGGSASYAVTVTPQNGFSGLITLSVSGLGAGASGSFSPPSLDGSGTSTLTIATTAGAATGGFTLTVGASSGSLTHETTVGLTVTPPPSDFSIAAAPASITLAPGGSATASISTATTSGAAQTVSLGATGAGSGVTLSFTPASVTSGGSSTLTATATASATAQTFTATITGTAASGSHTTTVAVAVTAPSSDFSVSVKPSAATVRQGRTAEYTVSTGVTSGSAQTVVLSVSGLPSGTTARFVPARVTAGRKSTLTVNTGKATPIGNYTLNVTATGTSGAHTTTALLVVVPRSE
jgi:hypothetical protein